MYSDKQTAIIIPARYESSRLRGKPLIEVGGKPIIQWVFEKAVQANLADRVIIATDNEQIYETSLMFGAEAEMTLDTHNSGSDRIAEVVSRHPEIAYIVNLQGDEPMINPETIDCVTRLGSLISFSSLISLTIVEISAWISSFTILITQSIVSGLIIGSSP